MIAMPANILTTLLELFKAVKKSGVSFQLSSKPCEPFFLSLSRFVSNLPLISLALSKGPVSQALSLAHSGSCQLNLAHFGSLSGSRYGSPALFEGGIVQEREKINKFKDDKPEYP